MEDWAVMTFDPELSVAVRPIIEHLTGRHTLLLTADQWEDMKEQIADMLEQFLELYHADD